MNQVMSKKSHSRTSNMLKIIGRTEELFKRDICENEGKLTKIVSSSRFLVLGGAGSIGQAVVKEIFKRNPVKLYVVDLSENNLVELVRDIRSSIGYIRGDFQTFALDIGSLEFDIFIKNSGGYDYVLNLSALKHVRSEKDPFTLMRMIDTNIFNTEKTINQSIEIGVEKYFCVSTDKAANPVNMMGASKRIMEMYVHRASNKIKVSMARFANVAFSDGSLLYGFEQRLKKSQPIVAPSDVKRYFLSPKESGELCLMSCVFGENRDVFFPKLSDKLHLITFAELATRYLKSQNLEPSICRSEEEARYFFTNLREEDKPVRETKAWPCYFSVSDTTGEKDFEEFYTENEVLDFESFQNLGVIKNEIEFDNQKLDMFSKQIRKYRSNLKWSKEELVELFHAMLPNFGHNETGKYLDSKM
jgi:FlaA1/EpsC-like NDP-sugar epimerase